MYVPGDERQPQLHKGSSSELGLLACASFAPRLEARLFLFHSFTPLPHKFCFWSGWTVVVGRKGFEVGAGSSGGGA